MLGPYVLGNRIAQGGMGEIFAAMRVGIGNFRKPVALKLLLTHLAEEEHIVEMFLGEALIAARMNHPNIVQVYDVGHENGRYFMAMELVRGLAMWSFIGAMARKGQRMPAALLSYIGRELCEGLHYAHELKDDEGHPLNVIHRDVTPANILLTEDGRAKLTDFGIAKARDVSTKTYPGTVKGTLEYLSPEQASGTKVDRRADVYCAGITLFHLATYQSPFWKGNDLATIQAIQNEPLPSLTRMRPDLPSALATALSKATHKDPNERYATARELRDALPPPPPGEGCAEELGKLVRELLGNDRPSPPHVPVPLPAAKPRLADHREKHDRVPFEERTLKIETPSLAAVGNGVTSKLEAESPTAAAKPGRKRSRVGIAFGLAALLAAGAVGGAYFTCSRQGSVEDGMQLEVGAPLVKRESAAGPARERRREKVDLKESEIPPPVVAAPAPKAEEIVAAPPPAEPVKEVAEEKVAAKVKAAEPSEEKGKKAARVGYLNVRSSKQALVYVAGKKIGETPLKLYPVAPGEVTVTVRSSGRTQKHVLRVAPGKASDLRAEWSR